MITHNGAVKYMYGVNKLWYMIDWSQYFHMFANMEENTTVMQ